MKFSKNITFFLLLVILFFDYSASQNQNSNLDEHLIKNESYRKQIIEMLDKQKELAKGRQNELFSILKSNLTLKEKEALEFLLAFLPLSDLADYNGEYYLDQVRAALKAMEEISWVKSIPEEIFLHFVLPIRVNNENLDAFRMVMYEEIKNRVKGMSMKEAALEINHWCKEKVVYKPSDIRTSAPLNTVKTSWGRCGEESVFTVEALRTAGIPARQVYTPRWAHTDDNHAWVEVWVDGKWYFLGACEPEPDLNMGWFSEPSRRTIITHSRAYGKYAGNEEVINSNDRFAELNLINNYALSKKLFVKVKGEDNKPVENAKVEYRLYNYCEFYPLAKTYTDKNGITGLSLGLGDIIVWASKGNQYGFQKITVGKIDTVIINISDKHQTNYTLEYDMVPPPQLPPREEPQAGKEQNQFRLQKEDSIRLEYNKSFKDSTWSYNLAVKLNLNADSLWKIIKKSYGNWNEIQEFLEKNIQNKDWLLIYLCSLTDKDIRDSKAEVLGEHLLNGLVNLNSLELYSQEFYTNYILSPRIGTELIRPWRKKIQEKFKADYSLKALKDMNILTKWIKENIKIDNDANTLSRCAISPGGVYDLCVADSYSRDIFFVALCRSLGIASRLNPVNNIPQYYNKKWIDVIFDARKESAKGNIHLINASNDEKLRYSLNFSVAKLNNGIYETLDLGEDRPIENMESKIEVDAGKYMLVTGNRLRDGSVLSGITFFEVKKNSTTDVKVKIRSLSIKPEKIGVLRTDNIKLERFRNNEEILINNLITKNGAILIWIDPEKEPSKHILNDLPSFTEVFNKWGGNFIFLLSKDKMNKGFDPKSYKNLPMHTNFVMDNNIISQIEKIKNRSLTNNYPVIIAIDKDSNIIFFSEGYTIGIGDQLTKIIKLIQ